MRRLLLLLCLLLPAAAFWWLNSSSADQTLQPLPKLAAPAKPLPGAQIFDQPTLLTFKVELASEALESLRREPRKSVAATVTIDGQTLTNVAVHLKGAAGSFRNVDDRPALTLSFSKFESGRRWMGLRKIHLNNSLQDSTYLNEYLASDRFRAANIPATRVAWATVELNQRKLGVYVLKEGFTEDFLTCFFQRTDGNLYDGGFVTDIDKELELDSGTGVADHSDLKALREAAQVGDPARRWERFQELLEMERFLDHMALSVMLADWDGYLLNRNNYRLYFNPSNGRAVFLPHGMDQLFQRAEMPIVPGWNGIVGRAVLDTPEGRKAYESRFQAVYAEVFRFERMSNAVARAVEVLRPVVPDMDNRARQTTARIAARIAYLERQPLIEALPGRVRPEVRATPWAQRSSSDVAAVGAPGPAPAVMPLANWQPQPAGAARLEQAEVDGRRVLRIVATGDTTASWRATLRLKPGRYRLEARGRAQGIEAVRDNLGEGAGLRISGATMARLNKLTGNTNWRLLAYEFEVLDQEREVTCVAELRARQGQVEFDLNSLRLVPQGR
jgi:spore coat protein H